MPNLPTLPLMVNQSSGKGKNSVFIAEKDLRQPKWQSWLAVFALTIKELKEKSVAVHC